MDGELMSWKICYMLKRMKQARMLLKTETNGKTKSSYKWETVTLPKENICKTLGLPMRFQSTKSMSHEIYN